MHGALVWFVHTSEEYFQSSILFRRTRFHNAEGLFLGQAPLLEFHTPQQWKKRQLVQHLRCLVHQTVSANQ